MSSVTPPDGSGAPPPPVVADAEGGSCPRCGVAYEPLQEYCLECGLRLPLARGVTSTVTTAWRRRLAYYPGDWVWPVLVALIVAALSAATVIAVKAVDADEPTPFFAETETVSPTDTLAAPPTIPPTETSGLPPTAPPPTTPPPTTPPPPTQPEPGQIREWPAGTEGWTVVLANLPEASGRAPATAKAKEASDAGLPDVGVLLSADFSSLHPGYYVVFSGIYQTKGEADAALANVRASGFDAAYSRQIAS